MFERSSGPQALDGGGFSQDLAAYWKLLQARGMSAAASYVAATLGLARLDLTNQDMQI